MLFAFAGLVAQIGVAHSAASGPSPAALAVGLNIWIFPPNQPPVISGTPPASVNVGSAYSFTPTASDPDGNALTFSIANKPAWVSLDSTTGRIAGTPGSLHVGTYSNIVITVSDGQASDTLGPFSITVVAVNRPPVIGGTPPASVTVGSAYSFTPTASDPDGNALTFSIVNRPAWLSFNTTTGRITGTPGSLHVGTYSNIVITVSDGQASDTLGPFSITVVAANRPPVIGGTPPASVNVGSAYSFTPTASDADGNALAFSIVNKPAWVTFNSTTGRITGTPTSLHVGTYSNIVITVSDGQASDTLAPFSITVVAVNRPPVIGGTPPASVTVGSAYSFTPTASDPDGNALTFSIVNKPVWAFFNATTGRLTGSPGSLHVGTYSNIVLSVSDGQASASLAPFSIVVQPQQRIATVSWTPPTTYVDGSPITNLAGFKIYYGRSLIGFTGSVTIPSPDITSAVIENLSSGTWYFAVKAYTTSNVESDFSAIRQKTFP